MSFRNCVTAKKPLASISQAIDEKLAAKAAGKSILPPSRGTHKHNLLAVAFANTIANNRSKAVPKEPTFAATTSGAITELKKEEVTAEESIKLFQEEEHSLAVANESSSSEHLHENNMISDATSSKRVNKNRRGHRSNKKKKSYHRHC